MSDSKYPPGTIAIVQGDMSRWADFDRFLVEVKRPDNVVFVWARGLNIAQARNECIKSAQGEWVWFLDDDMEAERDILFNLLERQVDIVQPLSLNRKTLDWNAFTGLDSTGFLPWRGSETTGLLPVVACGSGGTLYRRDVLNAFEMPIFRVGTFAPDVISEDLYVSYSATRKGFKCYVDLDNRMIHYTGCGLEIANVDGKLVKAVKLSFHKLLAHGV